MNKRVLFKNTQAGLINQLSGIVTRFIQVPVLLAILGTEGFGVWTLVYSIPGIFLTANLGFGSAYGNKIAANIVRREIDEASRNYSTGIFLAFTFGIVLVLLAILIDSVFDVASYLQLDRMQEGKVKLAVLYGLLGLVFYFPTEIYQGVLRGYGKSYYAINLSSLRPWVELFVVSISAYFSKKIEIISAAVALVSVLVFFLYFLMVRKIGELRYSWKSVSVIGLGDSLKAGVSFQGLAIGNVIVQQGTMLLVQAKLGVVYVAVFSTVRTMIACVTQFMGLVNTITWSEFSRLINEGNTKDAARLHRIGFILSNLIGVLGVCSLLVLGPIFYTMWTGSNLHVTRGIIFAFSVSVNVWAIYNCASVVLVSINKHNGFAIRHMLGAFAGVLLCYFLIDRFGLIGAGYSTCVINCFCAFYVFSTALRLTNDTYLSFFEGVLHEIKKAIQFKKAF